MADHLRRWNHHAVHVVQRMQTDARQPVVQPERVGTGGKGLRQGQACTILAPMPEQCLRTGHASLLQRFGKIDRLAVLAQSHEHRHLACRAAAEAELDAVDQPVQALRGIQLAAEQLVAQGGPGRLAPEIEREAVGLGEALGGGHDQRGRIGQRHETDVQGALSGASEPPAQAWLRIALSVITTSSAGGRRGPSRFPVRRRRRRRAFP